MKFRKTLLFGFALVLSVLLQAKENKAPETTTPSKTVSVPVPNPASVPKPMPQPKQGSQKTQAGEKQEAPTMGLPTKQAPLPVHQQKKHSIPKPNPASVPKPSRNYK